MKWYKNLRMMISCINISRILFVLFILPMFSILGIGQSNPLSIKCKEDPVVVEFPGGCVLDINAHDFIEDITCEIGDSVFVSLKEDVYIPEATITICDAPVLLAPFKYEIFAKSFSDHDSAVWGQGNPSSCHVEIIFLSSDNCWCDPAFVINGTISTFHGEPINGVQVIVTGTAQGGFFFDDQFEVEKEAVTSSSGKYRIFPPLEFTGEINPKFNEDIRNGISTLDVIAIIKHLTGKKEFEHAYQYLAADVNNNGKVTALDLVEIRKVILGISQSFPNNSSMIFINSDTYDDSLKNLHEMNAKFERKRTANSDSDRDLDFIGIKIGDINNTYNPN